MPIITRSASDTGAKANGGRLSPFLKWPGGKRWLTSRYPGVFPTSFARYFEPFLGSGAVYFHLKPRIAILSDTNEDLIATYRAVKSDPQAVERRLERHDRNHGTRYYYNIRSTSPSLPDARAARLIYLNRTCFNGIYRVNLRGEFNVPKGTKSAVILDTDNFGQAHMLLAGAELYVADFEDVITSAARDDLIFADPPYTVRHNCNGFVKYNEQLFSWDDQVRLVLALVAARDRGAKIVATNANHKSVKQLYEAGGFRVDVISRYSSISAAASGREEYEEILICN